MIAAIIISNDDHGLVLGDQLRRPQLHSARQDNSGTNEIRLAPNRQACHDDDAEQKHEAANYDSYEATMRLFCELRALRFFVESWP